uniref:Tyr recombinase domain-containing protein n=1 Tax=Thermodesulfobacterium geofontis TaxID=1295609 RepID=A0A7V5XGF2_9BACT
MEGLKIKDFRYHALRHTFTSYLIMNGVNFTTVKELLGNKNIKMTLWYSLFKS